MSGAFQLVGKPASVIVFISLYKEANPLAAISNAPATANLMKWFMALGLSLPGPPRKGGGRDARFLPVGPRGCYLTGGEVLETLGGGQVPASSMARPS